MAYIGVSPSNGIRRVFTYTATANQTSFSGVGAENITLSYKDANYVDVYQNGVKLASGDYTATSGTAIVLGTGATVNDMVVIVVFDVFSAADTVSKADGGQFDGNVTMAGTLGVTGVLTGTSLDISGDIDIDGTANLDVVDIDGAVDMASTLGVAGVVTANAGVVVDNITIDGTEIDLSSGNLTIDVAGAILLDADVGNVQIHDAGTEIGRFANSSSDFVIKSAVSDKDMIFKGNDGGSEITALTLDMSDAGKATFNAGADFNSACSIITNDNSTQLTLISTDTDSGVGPILSLSRDNNSAADEDLIGQIHFFAEDDGNNQTKYAEIFCQIADASNGSEDGRLSFNARDGGSNREFMRMQGSTGIVINEEGEADLDFRVESDSNANAFFLEASTGRIGMGTNAMGDYHANRDDLVIATSGSTGITIVAGGSGHQSAIAFADGTSDSAEASGLLMYNHNGNKMSFHVGDAEVFAADSNGLLINTATTNPGQNNTTTGASIVAGRFMFNNSGTDNIMGRADAGGLLSIRNGGTQVGLISVGGSSTTYATSSDYRLKDNIEYNWDATTRLKELKPARFNFKIDADTTVDGFIAHEVSSIVPEAISGEKDAMTKEVFYVEDDVIPEGKKIGDVKEASQIDPQGIDQSKLVPLLTKALQEALVEIDTLKTRVLALESA